MLFVPKNLKYKKYNKGKSFKKIFNNKPIIPFFSPSLKLISKNFGQLNSKQFIMIRFLIKKVIKKRGYLRFNIYPQKPVSKKPLEMRMGKGKGNINHWVCKIKVGVLICQIFYKKKIERNVLKILKQVQLRLPVKTKISF